tara:strand:- start:2332 stop:2559 length:228 start_codon:yes stop_codon:yes gene_type:complete
MQYYLAPIFIETESDGTQTKGPGTGDPVERSVIPFQCRGWDLDNGKVLVLTSAQAPNDWQPVDESYVSSNFPGAL